MANTKLKFPEPSGLAGEGNPESRTAAALEFIAYYLDRIEGHLESISISSAQGMGAIRSELRDVASEIKRHK